MAMGSPAPPFASPFGRELTADRFIVVFGLPEFPSGQLVFQDFRRPFTPADLDPFERTWIHRGGAQNLAQGSVTKSQDSHGRIFHLDQIGIMAPFRGKGKDLFDRTGIRVRWLHCGSSDPLNRVHTVD